jgi:hypothetical protein
MRRQDSWSVQAEAREEEVVTEVEVGVPTRRSSLIRASLVVVYRGKS